MKKRFEYKILNVQYGTWSGKPEIDVETTLNQLGSEGWELISSPYIPPHSHEMVVAFIFKREIVR